MSAISKLFDFEILEHEAYTVLYNTLVTVSPFLSPFLIWGSEKNNYLFAPRSDWDTWAEIKDLDYVTTSQTIRWLKGEHYGSKGQWLTFNASRDGKPLTVELRIAESHPTFQAGFCLIFKEIFKAALKKSIRTGTYMKPPIIINHKSHFSVFSSRLTGSVTGFRNENLYDVLKNSFNNVEFLRMIPRLGHSEYSNGLMVFDDLIRIYSGKVHNGHFDKLVEFFRNRLDPPDYWRAAWILPQVNPSTFDWERNNSYFQ